MQGVDLFFYFYVQITHHWVELGAQVPLSVSHS